MIRTLGSCTLFLALTLVCGVAAQAPPDKKSDKTDVPVPKEKEKKQSDPTQPNDELLDLLGKKKETEKLITVTLVGKVIGKNRPPIAILKLGEEELVVSKNDVVETSKVTLKILDIAFGGVQIEMTSPKPGSKIIIVR